MSGTFSKITAVIFLLAACTCKKGATTPEPDFFQLLKVTAGDITLSTSATRQEISTEITLGIHFSSPVDSQTVEAAIKLIKAENNTPIDIQISYQNDGEVVLVTPGTLLEYNTEYILQISNELNSASGSEFPGADYRFVTQNGVLQLVSATLNKYALNTSEAIRNVEYDSVFLELEFSEALDPEQYQTSFWFSPAVSAQFELQNANKTVHIALTEPLDYYSFYTINVSSGLTSAQGFEFEGYTASFQTGLDTTYKFPELTDDELLTKIQEATFRYFWDFAHPVSGLARERNTSGDVVTTGGSGFGVMAILVGIERGFISREEGIERLETIIGFLKNTADRFHGVWPHWLNGTTGKTIPFSTKDNGADLVETAFMAQGLIAVRQYLNPDHSTEKNLIDEINTLLDEIEWNWFTRDGQDVLYWHWSPDYGWDMNMPIRGYNEALIVYVLAASSKNYAIKADVYHKGWATSGSIKNGNEYYGYLLPVGYDFGGPLFFAHYSFLGLDPRQLSDAYADYWTQNRNHTLINRAYCISNPAQYVGYSSASWGLTASDTPNGYSAHSPTNDRGTITPTAAISSLPYTPEESLEAIRHFYYVLGDKLWGEYGFYDAFNPSQSWWASSYLAIDQGPIVVMIENYRTALIWNLFMSAPEVKNALDVLGFKISE